MSAADSPIEPPDDAPLEVDAFLDTEAPEETLRDAVDAAEPVDSIPAAPPPTVDCRRCRKSYPQDEPRCPWCRARNASFAPAASTRPASDDPAFLTLRTVFVLYGIQLLFTGIYYAALAQGGDLTQDAETYLGTVTGLEIIDAILVAIAFALTRHSPPPPDVPHKTLAWSLAFPLLAVALAINFGYHAVLQWVGFRMIDLPVRLDDPTLAAWSILAICVQPALVEEWFFRGVAWKAMRGVLGPHQTVWIVAVMFGMAHSGVPISIPVLSFVGVLFGYARLYSGGLLLPMLLHFVHNLIVVIVEKGL